MLHTTDPSESRTPQELAAALGERRRRGWAVLAVPPLALLIVAASALADTPADQAVAALSLLALALASAAFAAARA